MHRNFFITNGLKGILLLGVFFPWISDAASLALFPQTNPVTTGNIATVRLVLSANGTAINNAEGIVHFPTDMLRVVSVSKSSSIFPLWVVEPSYSNNAGTITFNGGVQSPGFSNDGGTVFTITFEAKKAGPASLTITDAAIRANDGLGTDVLSGASGTTLSIETPNIPVAPVSNTSTTPVPLKEKNTIDIRSTSHPIETEWYQSNAPIFSLSVPSAFEPIEMSVSSTTRGEAWSTLTAPYDAISLGTLSDGVWYFLVRPQKNSLRSNLSSFGIRVDRTPPVLTSGTISYDLDSSVVVVTASSTDATSGILKYTLSIDDAVGVPITPAELMSGSYRLKITSPGLHHATLTVEDFAGNTSFVTSKFYVPQPGNIFSNIIAQIGISTIFFGLILLGVLIVSLVSLGIALTTYRRMHTANRHEKHGTDRFKEGTHRKLVIFGRELLREIETLKRVKKTRAFSAEEKETIDHLIHEVSVLEREVVEKIRTIEDLE